MKSKATSPDPLNEREKEILKRLSTGLSDQQIADELFLSLNTVKWYNRQIYSKLGVRSRTQAIAYVKGLGLLDSGVSMPPLPVPRHNLPAQTLLFIGRSREIAEVKQLLHTSRLLTLTGTGGTGKTRLALWVAAEVAEAFADGVCFVDLAPLSDHTLVAKAIAGALGVFENPTEPLSETLKRVLAQRELLLLIDNFEHVIKVAPLVSELLAASSRRKFSSPAGSHCASPGSRNTSSRRSHYLALRQPPFSTSQHPKQGCSLCDAHRWYCPALR